MLFNKSIVTKRLCCTHFKLLPTFIIVIILTHRRENDLQIYPVACLLHRVDLRNSFWFVVIVFVDCDIVEIDDIYIDLRIIFWFVFFVFVDWDIVEIYDIDIDLRHSFWFVWCYCLLGFCWYWWYWYWSEKFILIFLMFCWLKYCWYWSWSEKAYSSGVSTRPELIRNDGEWMQEYIFVIKDCHPWLFTWHSYWPSSEACTFSIWQF